MYVLLYIIIIIIASSANNTTGDTDDSRTVTDILSQLMIIDDYSINFKSILIINIL